MAIKGDLFYLVCFIGFQLGLNAKGEMFRWETAVLLDGPVVKDIASFH